MQKTKDYLFKSRFSWWSDFFLPIIPAISIYIIYSEWQSFSHFLAGTEFDLYSDSYSILGFTLLFATISLYAMFNTSCIKIYSNCVSFRHSVRGFKISVLREHIKEFNIASVTVKSVTTHFLILATDLGNIQSPGTHLDDKEIEEITSIFDNWGIPQCESLKSHWLFKAWANDRKYLKVYGRTSYQHQIVRSILGLLIISSIVLIFSEQINRNIGPQQKMYWIVYLADKEIITTGKDGKTRNYRCYYSGKGIDIQAPYKYILRRNSEVVDTLCINYQSNLARYSADVSEEDYYNKTNFAKEGRYFWISSKRGSLGLFYDIKMLDLGDERMQSPAYWNYQDSYR